MHRIRNKLIYVFVFFCGCLYSQNGSVKGTVTNNSKPLQNALVALNNDSCFTTTNNKGEFELTNIVPGNYLLLITCVGCKSEGKKVTVEPGKTVMVNIKMDSSQVRLDTVEIIGTEKNNFGVNHMKNVEDFGIYAGKKSEVILMDNVIGNTATNNSRQIYSKISGLNIYENDGAGIQLGIGGRGMNPNRVANFNTRQNGYDMSADALGYPDSYYAPPSEALERVEIIRGASSLQFGPQFGGFINFKLKKGNPEKQLEVLSRNTIGIWIVQHIQ